MQNGDLAQGTTQILSGRYRLLRRIGRGGMGEVWLGEDPRLHRQVAIKMLPSHNQGDREYLQRFEREAQAAAALNHPHILPVHDYGEQVLPNRQAITYIVMPYLSGGSLEDRLSALADTHRLMPPQEALTVLAQAAEAIDYAHAQGIIHRDIKPANMLLRGDDWLMLADFGIARMLSEQERLTQTGTGFGTAEYMAPEQAQGKAVPASDIYSLAVIAYRLLSGHLPFQAETPYATTIQHIIMPPPSPRQFNPTLSLATEQVLLQGLAKDPSQRPPSAHALVASLQQAVTGAPYEITRPRQPLQAIAAPLSPVAATVPAIPQTEPAATQKTFADTVPAGKASSPTTAISRRKVLLGATGTALLVLGGGTGILAFIEHDKQQGPQPTTTTVTGSRPQSTKTPGPNDPVMTLLSHTRPVSSLAWSPRSDTLLLASAGEDQQVMLWDIAAIRQGLANQKTPHTIIEAGTGIDMQLAWSPDGAYIAIGNGKLVNPNDTFNTGSFVLVYTADLRSTVNSHLVTTFLIALAWTPGKYLAIASSPSISSSSNIVALWNPAQPTQTPTPVSFSDVISALAFSPVTAQLAIALPNAIVIGQAAIVGNRTTWKAGAHSLQTNNLGLGADTITWSPDETFLAAANKSLSPPVIDIWNWKQGSTITSPIVPDSSTMLTALAWSPAAGSPLLADGTKNGSVLIWKIDRSSPVSGGNLYPHQTLNGLSAEVFSLAWSPDGQWLAASYKDVNSSILVWSVKPS